MQVEITNGDILVDAALLAKMLTIEPGIDANPGNHERLPEGIDAHQNQFRLSFFYQNRRARLNVDSSGHILRRSIVDVGCRRVGGKTGD